MTSEDKFPAVLENSSLLYSEINCITPYQRHYGLDINIIKVRNETYKKAKVTHPERWSGEIRDWSLPEYVTLNPLKDDEVEEYLKQQSS